MVYILVPCKRLDDGKSRLSPCLDAAARRRFCQLLLKHTLQQAVATVGAFRVRLVTCDLDAIMIGTHYSVETIFDRADGLNAALENARNSIISNSVDVDELLILPIDLPFISTVAISKMMSCAGDVVLAPDENGTGTNGIMLRSPAIRKFPFAFGPDSYAAHAESARACGLVAATFHNSQLSFDVDVPQQYKDWSLRSSAESGINSN
jgi:2-phospho-L-lactate/phosphoenolpyruvate guanylyltransferase